MRRLFSILLLLLIITPCLRAQKKELSQARSYIKSGSNLNVAEDLMRQLLVSDSLNRRNHKIYQTWYQAVKKQYDIENEKLYLNQKCDTARVYILTKKMLDICLKWDSIDVLPNHKGKIRPKYRKSNAAIINDLRPNLFFGGTYNVNKSKFDEAFAFFDAYISCADSPLFSDYNYAETDPKMVEAAYWATLCGYKHKDAEMTLKYKDIALRDTTKLMYVLSYISEAYMLKKDTANLVSTLNLGFCKYPTYSYFFPRLLDYYNRANQEQKSLEIVDRALSVDSNNVAYQFAKASVLFRMKRYDECIAISDRVIQLSDSVSDAYYLAGLSYFNQTIELSTKTQLGTNKINTTKSKARQKELYSKALPYFEKYRELQPALSEKWAPTLYTIYLNLNMGQQFDEIDKILKEQ